VSIERYVLAAILAIALGASQAQAADFSRQEAEIITLYYHDVAQPSAQRGRGKGLPRGIAKNLARGKSLPPGIAKQQLPSPLIARLPPPPAGFERIVVSGKVLLIETATQIIHDVLTDVLFR
jgi:Ni/Co efflux regulator RcnB